MTRLDPDAIEVRLRWLADQWTPRSHEEVIALMTPAPREETVHDAAQARLDELRALLELTHALHNAGPFSPGGEAPDSNDRRR